MADARGGLDEVPGVVVPVLTTAVHMPRKTRSRAPSPVLSLSDASFRFGDEVIFPHTTWAWRKGEHWAVIGPNGSGKSLFSAAIRGLLPVVAGEVSYNFPGRAPDEAIIEVSFSDRKVELPDAVAQSRWFSVEEEASLRVGELLSYERVMEVNPFEITDRHERARPAFERRRARAVSLLDLEPLLSRGLLSLSNGESQRVHVGRALCRPLRLLILDDPWLGLDTQTRKHFRRVLRNLMRSMPVMFLACSEEHLPREVTHLLRVQDCRVISAEPFNPVGRVRVRGKLPPAARAAAQERPAAYRKPLIEMRNVTVRYGDRVILDRLNWRVQQGENWAVLGPNGCGKTTLLSLIVGDHPQVYGNEVVVFGKRLGDGESIWELKQHIGYVSPDLQLHFQAQATCFETVASGFHDSVGLFEKLKPGQERQTRRWLKRFGLQQHVDAPFAALSAGAQRATLLARALVKTPRLLLMDEPCQGLDPTHRSMFLRLLKQISSNCTTTLIYVTHRLEEIPPAVTNRLLLSGKTTGCQ